MSWDQAIWLIFLGRHRFRTDQNHCAEELGPFHVSTQKRTPRQSAGPSCVVSSGTGRCCGRLIVVILECLTGLLHQIASVVSWNPTWSAKNGDDMRNGNVNCIAAWVCNKFH
jgi:hypothetical protein